MDDSTDLSSSSSDNDIDDIDTPQDPKIVEYQETRKDLRKKADRNDRRFIRGVLVIAPILYYSFVYNPHMVVFIPWVIGFLFILGKQRWVDIDFLAKKCHDIEKEVDIDEFGWETKYGRFDINNKRKVRGLLNIRLDTFPFYMGYLMGLITYLFFIFYSVIILDYNFLSGIFPNAPTGKFENRVILGSYTIFSIILILVWKFENDLRKELMPDEEEDEEEDKEDDKKEDE